MAKIVPHFCWPFCLLQKGLTGQYASDHSLLCHFRSRGDVLCHNDLHGHSPQQHLGPVASQKRMAFVGSLLGAKGGVNIPGWASIIILPSQSTSKVQRAPAFFLEDNSFPGLPF